MSDGWESDEGEKLSRMIYIIKNIRLS